MNTSPVVVQGLGRLGRGTGVRLSTRAAERSGYLPAGRRSRIEHRTSPQLQLPGLVCPEANACPLTVQVYGGSILGGRDRAVLDLLSRDCVLLQLPAADAVRGR